MNTYTLNTNHWTGNVELWAPNGEVWNTTSEAEAVKLLAYSRMAYPGSMFSLLKDGYIVSTLEISQMAKHLLN